MQKNIETNKTTKVDSGDGVCNSKVSCLTLNDATEKEYPKSEVNSGSLNNAIIDDPEFADVMCGSALVLKEIHKDETKEIVKLALKLEETGNVGSDVDEGTEATLTDTKTEIAGVDPRRVPCCLRYADDLIATSLCIMCEVHPPSRRQPLSCQV